jgi:hypothetical protein
MTTSSLHNSRNRPTVDSAARESSYDVCRIGLSRGDRDNRDSFPGNHRASVPDHGRHRSFGDHQEYDRPPVSSISVAAPTFTMATPPASLARRSWSFSRSQSESVSSKRRSGVAGSEGFEVDGAPPGHRASLISRL